MESVQVEINEVWRSIDGYLNYQVSNIGRVRNTETGKIFKPSVNSNGYYNVVLRKDGKPYNHKVHRLVAHEFLENPEVTQKLNVDHIDRNKLNNQVTNLRYATQSQNMMNRTKSQNTTSKYKGVNFHKKSQKWVAQIQLNNKNLHLGLFNSEEVAAEAYNTKAIELFGEFANLNVIV
jgi:hypothetical protein